MHDQLSILKGIAAWLVLSAWAPAAGWAQDVDLDGVSDVADAFPCDWRRSAVSFVPSESGMSTLLLEDNWPARGDLDFNDAVVAHQLAFFHDASGGVTGLRIVLVPRALGASIRSGLGLQLPIPRAALAGITRSVRGQASPIEARPGADAIVVELIPDLRELMGVASGYVNTDRGLASVGDGPEVVVELSFSAPVSLPLSTDLFFFRVEEPTHEIHQPGFRGTATMNTALFGTGDDGTTGSRAFVDRGGLPFLLVVPSTAPWARELSPIDALWPDITRFAASAGELGRDFYATNVDTSKAFAAPSSVITPAVARDLCVAPTCTDGARNGRETDVDCGADCGGCGLTRACRGNADCESGACFDGTCTDALERPCATSHGTGLERRTAAGWGACEATACDAGYRVSGGACVLITYAWSAGAWGACANASASPSYGAWGSCVGGTGTWTYGAWGACSASGACTGAGTQSRASTCDWAANSGVQSRSAACGWDPGTGSQSRAVTCVSDLGEPVASALCAGAPPSGIQSCTPSTTPASCGLTSTTQSCTPGGSATCAVAAANTQACASPAGSRSCAVSNGTGTQSCAAGATAWGACAASSCAAGYHVESGACVSDLRACALVNGTGTQTWAGSAYGACVATACDSGYHLEAGLCGADQRFCTTTSGTGQQSWADGAWGTCEVIMGTPAGSSCQTRWAASAGSASSGLYSIDPDGPGSNPAFNVWCDMRADGGWEVITYDSNPSVRGARGTPSASPGWSLDYVSASAPLRNLRVDSFAMEVDGVARRVFDGVTVYGSAARPTVNGLFGGTHPAQWECRSDAPSASCAITTRDGRHWGFWESTSSCCLGGGGFWLYSRVGNAAENWGICGNGRPNGLGYTGGTTGCTAGASTPLTPGSTNYRISVRLYVTPRADGTTCRTILDSGASAGSGVYFIDPDGSGGAEPMAVWCDMTTDGGGWTVVHDDTYANARVPRAIPSSGTGWNVDYLTSASPLSTMELQDFRMEIPGAWTQTWRDVVRYGTNGGVTPPMLFSGGHNQSWQCNTDAPSSDCYFTTRADGRQWGVWDHTSSCCLGSSTGGFWFYSASSAGTQNFGICTDGFPDGTGYAVGTSGCTGAGYYTPVTPAASRRFRLMFREASQGTARNLSSTTRASCREILNAGESFGTGLYWLRASGGASYLALCDMTTDGGGWTTIFAGRNGSNNVFDHYDAALYSGVCTDPSRRCMRRLPSSIPLSGTELAVVHGTAAVSMPLTSALQGYLASGTQGNWVTVTATDLGTGQVSFLPDTAWLGTTNNPGFIFTRGQSSSQIFASAYDLTTSWNMGNGVSGDQSYFRLMYREGGRPADPIYNASGAARTSCRAILDRGESRGDGLYYLQQSGGSAYLAFCDMTTDGGGWTTFFATRNGSANVIDQLDAGYFTGVCTDPRRRCVRRMPAAVPPSGTEFAASLGDATVAIPVTSALYNWAVSGTQSTWQTISSVSIGSGSPVSLPDSFWTGSGSNRSFVITRGQTQANTFASSYNLNTTWDIGNSRANSWSPIRLMYREGGPPPVAGAFTSCRAARNAGNTADGVYVLQQSGGRAYRAYCDMTTDGGGWTAIYAGRNGSPNTFDRFEAGYYSGICTDPEDRCLRRIPSTVPVTGTQLAVRCGSAMVRVSMSTALQGYLSTGTQQSWIALSGAVNIGSAAVPNLPDYFWGGAAGNPGFIFTRGQSPGVGNFAASYSNNSSWDRCNGALDATSRLRVFYREP